MNSTTPIPEVHVMVAAAKQFVADEIHFSALVGPITNCEWWCRVSNANSHIHRLAVEWRQLVDRVWNEYGQHDNPLTVEKLRMQIKADLGEAL
ncbi:hypothetical protein [Bremerella sp.]|uniref:hypothetical protein n=1 Tax=Bremerella sp. TaxID=2795602 RepID=UPI003919FC2A